MNTAVAQLVSETQKPKKWDDVALIEDMLRRAIASGNEYGVIVEYLALRDAGESVHEASSIASCENGIG